MVRTLYYAVNASGQGVIFTSYPLRDDKRRIWLGDMASVYTGLVMEMESEVLISLPVMKWSDDPVKLELNLQVCSEKPR